MAPNPTENRERNCFPFAFWKVPFSFWKVPFVFWKVPFAFWKVPFAFWKDLKKPFSISRSLFGRKAISYTIFRGLGGQIEVQMGLYLN